MSDAIDLFGRDPVERAHRYHRPLYAAAIGNLLLGLALLATLAFTPAGDRLYDPLEGWDWWAAAAVFTVEVVALAALVRLPLRFWAGYAHERAWGLSPQSLGGWAGDRAKALAVELVIAVAAAVGLVAVARTLPSGWPVVAAVVAALAVLLLTWIAPVVLEPLFSRVRPLEDAELAAGLRALAERSGVPLRDVLVSDASRRTSKLNAYVSGLGRTRRLVLFDTLLARSTPREVRLVVAHELGHQRERHLAKGVALGMVGAVLFVVVLWAALSIPGLRAALGATGAQDPRAIPFVFLTGAVLEVLTMPFGAALSRRWERTADRLSLELTADADSFEAIHRELALANLSDLDPPRALYLAFFTHPTAPERIRSARRPGVAAVGAAGA
jgi:STE24 endopeptidase